MRTHDREDYPKHVRERRKNEIDDFRIKFRIKP